MMGETSADSLQARLGEFATFLEEARLSLDAPVADLDSLQAAEVAAFLEAAGVVIDEGTLAHATDLEGILRLLSTSTSTETVTAAGRERPSHSHTTKEAAAARLSDAQVRLSPVASEHLPFLYHLAVSEEIGFRWRFRGAVPAYDLFTSSLWHGVLAQFVVVDATEGQPLGHVVCYNSEPNYGFAYLGVAFVPMALNPGLPITAVRLFVRYLFATYNLRKLYMELPSFNYDSIASGNGVDFMTEGVLREHSYWNGRFWDQYLLAIYRDRPNVDLVPEREQTALHKSSRLRQGKND